MNSDEGESTSSEKAARIISLLTISPFQIVLYMVFAGVICTTLLEEFILNTISGIFYLLIPFIPLAYVIWKNKIRNSSIPRENRLIILLIQIVGFTCAASVYYFYPLWTGLDAQILFIFTVGYIILNGICAVITSGFKYKISLHMTGTSSSITGLFMVLGWPWGFLLLFCIPIAWARVKLKAHTLSQVVSGTLLGIIVIILTYVGFWYL
jgi:membrane-associated phospholipid phosphatase